MKKVVLSFLTIFLLMQCVEAQDTMRTLLKLSKPKYLGLYVAPEFQYGQLSGDFTSFGGSSFMLLLDKKFAIGLTAQRSLDNQFVPTNTKPLYAQSAFGGVKMEYTLKSDKALHLSFPLVVGMGFVRADSVSNNGFGGRGRRDDWDFDNGRLRSGNQYAVIQPGIQLEGNLFRYMKLFAGANYRIAWQTDGSSTVLTKTAMQGLSINAGLKLGLFDFRLGRKKAKEATL